MRFGTSRKDASSLGASRNDASSLGAVPCRTPVPGSVPRTPLLLMFQVRQRVGLQRPLCGCCPHGGAVPLSSTASLGRALSSASKGSSTTSTCFQIGCSPLGAALYYACFLGYQHCAIRLRFETATCVYETAVCVVHGSWGLRGGGQGCRAGTASHVAAWEVCSRRMNCTALTSRKGRHGA